MDLSMYSASAVEMVRLLLDKLPPQGCRYCLCAPESKPIGQVKNCCCDKIFLAQRPPTSWRPSDDVCLKGSSGETMSVMEVYVHDGRHR